MKVKSLILRKMIIFTSAMTFLIVVDLIAVFFLFNSVNAATKSAEVVGTQNARTVMLFGYVADMYRAVVVENSANSDQITQLSDGFAKDLALYDTILASARNGDLVPGSKVVVPPSILEKVTAWEDKWTPFRQQLVAVMDSLKSGSVSADALSAVSLAKTLEVQGAAQEAAKAVEGLEDQGMSLLQKLLLVIIILVIMFSVGISVVIRRDLLPIQRIMEVLQSMRNQDLTNRANLKSNNEIGILGKNLDSTGETLSGFIGGVKQVSQTVGESNERLVSSMGQSSAAIEEMMANIGSIHQSLQKSNEVLQTAAQAVMNLQDSTSDMKSYIEQQANSVNENTATIEELVTSIKTVADSTIAARDLSSNLQSVAVAGKDKIEASINAMFTMEDSSKRITESVQGISKIAASTNLLAMNAAIEAAHAGDAGAGFAVVAQEIRSLAESSAKEAKTIKSLMDSSVATIKNGAGLSREAGAAFAEIMKRVEETVKISTEIALAMDEQRLAAQDMLKSISKLQSLSGELQGATGRNVNAQEGVVQAVDKIQDISREILNASNEQQLGGQEIVQAMGELREVADITRQTVVTLNEKVGAFKI